jgi:hypothetical protein
MEEEKDMVAIVPNSSVIQVTQTETGAESKRTSIKSPVTNAEIAVTLLMLVRTQIDQVTEEGQREARADGREGTVAHTDGRILL